MLRVGYPSVLDSNLLSVMPEGIELIPLGDGLDPSVEVDVWIPDPYPTRAMRIWPHLRGVRLVLSLMAGTEWIPGTVGPHVTICNARGAHNISTAEWTITAILAMLKYLPTYVDIQRSGDWRRRSEVTNIYEAVDSRSSTAPSSGHTRRADRQGGTTRGLWFYRKGHRAHA